MAAQWKPKRGRKLTLDEVERALAAHDRAQVVSDEIRLTMGPWTAEGSLPDHRRVTNSVVETWRARMAERETKRTAPRAVSTTVDASPLDEVAKAAAARKRAESRVARAVRQAKEAGVSVAEVASQLGMTRQGVYAMLARS
jgi:hypothetical protein